ncbi:MAG: hemerythrin domain-containing protein [Planctomycetes bacterium]|nr:hemerythrin domain-containing protein [Planctomycetota bacterium]
MTQESLFDKPTGTLREEHQVILRVINVLGRLVERSEQGRGFERNALGECVEFFRSFADACHHAKEEDLLFPLLQARGIPRDGGPIGVMLSEHQLARGFTKDMAGALEAYDREESNARDRFHSAARDYRELLTHHISKEDQILFTMGDQVMSEEDQSSLCKQFCGLCSKQFGGRTREELERMADTLEANWPA